MSMLAALGIWLIMSAVAGVFMCLFFAGASHLDKQKSHKLDESFNKAKDESGAKRL